MTSRICSTMTSSLCRCNYVIIICMHIKYSHVLVLGQSDSGDRYIGENVKAVCWLITRATLDPISPNIKGGLPISPPLSGVISQYWDPVEFDHGIGRLMVKLEKKHLASMKTNQELVAIKLNTGYLYLIIITARIPETKLKGGEREWEVTVDMSITWTCTYKCT